MTEKLPTDLPPMDGALARLLNSELQRPDPNSLERAGVSQRLQAALPQLGWTATAALLRHVASHAAGSAAGAAAAGARASLPLARVILISALSAGMGAAGGAALHARLAQPASSAPAPAIIATPPLVAPPAPDAMPDTPAPAPTPLPARRPATHPPAATPEGNADDSDVELRREQALVDRARAAVARRDATEALSAIDAHAARYPKGRLSEERDALRVQALALTGQAAPTRAAAADFQRRYPQSLLWPSIRRTLEQLH